jgi:DNA-binding beta-propeller fold protein YncE
MKSLLKRLTTGLLACTLLATAGPVVAGEYLAVANRGSRDISLIRLKDHRMVAKVQIHPTGKVDDVAATPDGVMLLANVQFNVDERPNVTPSGEIVAISTLTGKRVWATPLEGIPHHITVSADGKEVFVPLFDRQRIEVFSTATGEKLGSMFAKWGMHTTRLSHDGKLLYAGSIFTGQVYAFDIASRKLVKTLTLTAGELGGIAVRPFVVTKDDATVYAQLSGLHGIATLKVGEKTADIYRHGDLPQDFEYPGYPYNVDHGLELSPDEKTLVAVSESTRKAYIFSVNPLVLRKELPIGRIPKWVSFSGSGDHAYISNAGDSDVSVISMKSLSEVARIATAGDGGTIMRVIQLPDGNVDRLARGK